MICNVKNFRVLGMEILLSYIGITVYGKPCKTGVMEYARACVMKGQ